MRFTWPATSTIIGLIAAGSAAAQTTLTGSSWVPPTHPLTKDMLVVWGQNLEKASAGRIKFNVLPKSVTAAPGTFDAVRDGLVDVSYTVHGYTPGRFVLTKMAEMPFLGDSATTISIAYNRIFEREIAKFGEHKGVKVLGVFTHGPGQMYTVKKPINTLADLQGTKIRVGGGIVNDVTNAMGAVSLLKAAPEAYEILSNGVADGTFFPAESIKSFKLEQIVKYATQVPGGLYNTSFVMLMNEDRFNKLSKADQDAVMSVSGEALARVAGNAWDPADKAGWEAARAAGVQVTTASPALVSEIKAKIASVESNWVNEAKPKGLDGAKVLADFRAEIQKVASGK